MKHSGLLTWLILVALGAGVFVGQFVLYGGETLISDEHWTKTAGELVLIRPLKLLIIPLILFSVLSGICKIGDPSKLGLVGGTTVLYYLATMLIAVTLGTLLVTNIAPGNLEPEIRSKLISSGESSYQKSAFLKEKTSIENREDLGSAWLNIIEQIIPTNVFENMVNSEPLGVIVFSILLGLAIAAGGKKTQVLRDFIDAGFNAIMRLVQWIIWLTPIGVFFLVAWTVGKIGLGSIVGPMGQYITTVIAGLAIHGLIILPFFLFLFGKTNPYKFMSQMKRALATAFGTDSSSATLPVTIQCAESQGGCSKRASNFVLPLGSVVNMDGTALYEAVAVVFLFQLYGIDLSSTELIIVVITATLAAIGAAGIPSAGLVTMVIVIEAVNTSLAGEGIRELPVAAIGVIWAVDRMVDMCRTVVNVWGDAVGAKIITKIAPD